MLSGFLFLILAMTTVVFNMIPTFMQKGGEGVVVKRMYRAGLRKGVWVQLEDGTEIPLPGTSTELRDVVKEGDYIIKKQYSFMYQVNEQDYNTLIDMVFYVLVTWLFLSIMFSVIFLVSRMLGLPLQNPKKEE